MQAELPFQIGSLDHVALRVKDLETSVRWYTDILGLKQFTYPDWDGVPVMMLSQHTGVALFPLNTNEMDKPRPDHFAFRVDEANFQKALGYFEENAIPFEVQDHQIFESIYLKDPDGHIVELMKEK